NQNSNNFARHRSSQFSGTVFVGSTHPSAQRTRIANINDKTLASHSKVCFAGNSLVFHFKRAIADAKRKHIRTHQHCICFERAPLEMAGPTPLHTVEFEPVIPAADSDVVNHPPVR